MSSYTWARRGDVNAFFGLMLDNVAVLIILFAALTAPDRSGEAPFTPEFVLTRMIPGTALGVLLGDLVYTWMAFRLARRTGRDDVTAMPLGLDTPSTFGFLFLILLPAWGTEFDRSHNREQAMEFAWHVGLTVLVISGVFKLLLAPTGNLVRRLIPRAGLLGSLAAIALALIAFLPLLLDGIAAVPLVGMLSLSVILVTLVAHRELPFRFPGALAAVLVGVVMFWLCRGIELGIGIPLVPPIQTEGGGSFRLFDFLAFYSASGEHWDVVLREALAKLPVALPFALATVVGGIDCTESAGAAGDEYDTRVVLFTEAIASILAGLLGGVIQTTPYIGHPAYKKMGGRAAYTLATALFIGAVGVFGGFTLLFNWLPRAAMFPILVFVGLEITAQSFHATPSKHYPALVLATLPALAALMVVVAKGLGWAFVMPPGEKERLVLQTLRCLSNGFLISGMLWATGLAFLLDGKLYVSAVWFAVAGVCAFFGVIHSPLADEQIGLPWVVLNQVQPELTTAIRYQTPYHWTVAYGLAALLLVGLGAAERREAPGLIAETGGAKMNGEVVKEEPLEVERRS
jgi:adenine/guanine/hypoxanthine permease